MNARKAVRLSVLLHMSPLILFAHIPGCGGGKTNAKEGSKPNSQSEMRESERQEILAKPKSVDVENVTEADLNGYKKVIKKRFKVRDCPGLSYGGIGIQFNYDLFNKLKMTINDVPAGYPAAKAGVEVGDELIDDSENVADYCGEVGKEVTVAVKKPDGTIKNYVMLREKICLKSK